MNVSKNALQSAVRRQSVIDCPTDIFAFSDVYNSQIKKIFVDAGVVIGSGLDTIQRYWYLAKRKKARYVPLEYRFAILHSPKVSSVAEDLKTVEVNFVKSDL